MRSEHQTWFIRRTRARSESLTLTRDLNLEQRHSTSCSHVGREWNPGRVVVQSHSRTIDNRRVFGKVSCRQLWVDVVHRGCWHEQSQFHTWEWARSVFLEVAAWLFCLSIRRFWELLLHSDRISEFVHWCNNRKLCCSWVWCRGKSICPSTRPVYCLAWWHVKY